MILLKGGFFIDTLNLDISKKDVLIDNGIIRKIGSSISVKKPRKVFNIEGKFISPALFDMHVHCRVPGKEYAEDFFSISRSAIRGGVGSVVAMPNTTPVIDNVVILRKLIERARKEAKINIFFTSSITRSQEGKESVDVEANSDYVVGFSDDGKWVVDLDLMADVMRRAFRKGKVVFSHPQVSSQSISSCSEYLAVFRDCMIAVVENVPLHLQHLSSAVSVDIVREAKRINPRITSETSPHYFWFSEDDVKDANFKMNPPLRTKEDIDGIIKGIMDGSIDVISTDHAPHTPSEKALDFSKAPFGVIGLETLLASSVDKLHLEKKIPLPKVIRMMSLNPATICGVNAGFIREGGSADLCVFAFKKWKYTRSFSKSINTPFLGMEFKTKVEMLFLKGNLHYANDRFFI